MSRGSSIQYSAIVMSEVVEMMMSLLSAQELTLGCSVEVTGTLLESSHSGQAVELQADSINLVGQCNPQVREIAPVLAPKYCYAGVSIQSPQSSQ